MKDPKRLEFYWRITAAHTISYFIAGIFAITFLNYKELFNVGPLSFMRETSSPWVAAGPGLQLIRGIILGSILYPFTSIFLDTKWGWLKFWVLTFGLSYILTISAAVGSFEGIIYTNIPIKTHLLGLPEILLYNTLFTIILWAWYKKPRKAFNIIAIILITIMAFMSIMGVLAAKGIIEAA